jgi:tetratricopeptide (TPR) repeat protein
MSVAASEPDPLEQAAESFLARLRAGERPALSEYEAKHPELAAEIRELFPALALLEEGRRCVDRPPAPDPSWLAEGQVPQQLGEYRLLREVGRGGMGVVYEAWQEALGRHVALKVLPFNRLTQPERLERFRREARAAARLHHTNIVPIFGVGECAGVHYYAMEFIRGQGLDTVLQEVRRLRGHDATGPEGLTERRSTMAQGMVSGRFEAAPSPAEAGPGGAILPTVRPEGAAAAPPADSGTASGLDLRAERPYFASVARLGVQVAEALDYAHGQGVIHRDIKPSNLLVDTAGRVWVTDFGLAKTEGTEALTQAHDIVGTPRYMAPERFRGEADGRSDVYGLGVTLYELLTLRPAFEPAPYAALVEQIASVEPPRPRQLDPHIPRDLETVVLKATAKEPGRRYASAGELAEDLRRFLDDRPVRARRTPWRERAWRWCRHNRAAVLTVALVLFVLLAGIAGTTFGLIRAEEAWAEEARQRQQAETAKKKAETAKKKAEKAAADTLADYRAITDDAIEQLIGRRPALDPLERAFLERTLKRWQVLAALTGDDERSREIRAEGHFRVGQLWYKLGRNVEARAEYEKALGLLRQLADAFPATPEYQLDLANTHNNLANLHTNLGQRDQARVEYETALGLLRKLAEAFPAVPAYRRSLGNTRYNLGKLLIDFGQHEKALMQYTLALGLRRRLADELPAVPGFKQDLANSHHNLGDLLAGLGQRDEARAEYEKALDLERQLVKAFPAVLAYQQNLAATHHRLGLLLADLGKRDEARVEYEKARSRQRQLVKEYPAVVAYQMHLATTQYSLGHLLARLGERDAARAECEAARDLLHNLASAFPAVPDYREELATAHNFLAIVLIGLGKPDEVRAEYEKAIGLLRQLVADFPNIITYQVKLGAIYCNFGHLLRAQGRPADSLEWYAKGINTLTAVHAKQPRAAGVQSFLRNGHWGRAQAYDRLGQHARALKDWDKTFDLSPPKQWPQFRAPRALSRLRAGQITAAVAEVAELTTAGASGSGLPRWSAAAWYNFACVYAVASGREAARQEEYATRAVELLHRAVKAGWTDARRLANDRDLDPLRQRADFQKLLAGLQAGKN